MRNKAHAQEPYRVRIYQHGFAVRALFLIFKGTYHRIFR